MFTYKFTSLFLLRPLDHLRGADRLKSFRRDDKGRLRLAPEGVPWLSDVYVVSFAHLAGLSKHHFFICVIVHEVQLERRSMLTGILCAYPLIGKLN